MPSITAGFIKAKRRRDSRQTIPIKWRICPQVQGWENGEPVATSPSIGTAAFALADVKGRSLAARYRLPAVYPFRFFAELGGLISYGVDLNDNFRRAVSYADRVLRGAKPSELPVQAPVKFELVINLKTAKAISIDIPLQLKQRADEVIE